MARGAKAVVRPPLPIAEEQFAYPLARDAERFLDHLLLTKGASEHTARAYARDLADLIAALGKLNKVLLAHIPAQQRDRLLRGWVLSGVCAGVRAGVRAGMCAKFSVAYGS